MTIYLRIDTVKRVTPINKRENIMTTKTKWKVYKMTLENGYQWITNINPDCSEESTRRYFLGKWFNSAPFPLEVMSQCISVEFLGESSC